MTNETNLVASVKGWMVTPAIARRQRMEMAIARKLVREALKAGFSIGVDNGGDEPELAASRSEKAILNAMMETDEEHLILYRDGKRFGWVFFVYGNGGWDVINDYTTNLEPLMGNVEALSDRLERSAR